MRERFLSLSPPFRIRSRPHNLTPPLPLQTHAPTGTHRSSFARTYTSTDKKIPFRLGPSGLVEGPIWCKIPFWTIVCVSSVIYLKMTKVHLLPLLLTPFRAFKVYLLEALTQSTFLRVLCSWLLSFLSTNRLTLPPAAWNHFNKPKHLFPPELYLAITAAVKPHTPFPFSADDCRGRHVIPSRWLVKKRRGKKNGAQRCGKESVERWMWWKRGLALMPGSLQTLAPRL